MAPALKSQDQDLDPLHSISLRDLPYHRHSAFTSTRLYLLISSLFISYILPNFSIGESVHTFSSFPFISRNTILEASRDEPFPMMRETGWS